MDDFFNNMDKIHETLKEEDNSSEK